MLNVVVLNGGRGAASIIPALLAREGLNVASVVNAYDDGKSTGEIRRFFHMLGPSDIRKVQQLMLPKTDPHFKNIQRIFEFRYPEQHDKRDILEELTSFAGGASTLAGIAIGNASIGSILRRFIGEFVKGLGLIERISGQSFSFADCSLMNCIYAGAYLALNRDFEAVTMKIDRLFRLKGTVLPNSVENRQLAAIRKNGDVLYCEADIVELRSNVLIDRIYLLENGIKRGSLDTLSHHDRQYFLKQHHAPVKVSEGVRRALVQADIIIFAAGTQHSSLYPTYLSTGLGEAISSNRTAAKIFITNIGADYETPTYTASDFIKGAYRYICMGDGRMHPMEQLFSTVLVNNSRIKSAETYVNFDKAAFSELPVELIVENFEDSLSPGKHDGEKVVGCILDLYDRGFSH